MKKTILTIVAFLLVIISTNAQIRKRNVETQKALTTNIGGTITLNTDKSPTVCVLPDNECSGRWTIDLFEVIDPEQGGEFVNTSYTLKSLKGRYKYTIMDMGNRTYSYQFTNVPKNIKTVIAISYYEKIYKVDNAEQTNKRINLMMSQLAVFGATKQVDGLQTNQNSLLNIVTDNNPTVLRDITISNAVTQEIH